MPTQADIEHLLRRTEFVARPERVAELNVEIVRLERLAATQTPY